MYNPNTVWNVRMFDRTCKAKMIETIQSVDGTMRVKVQSVSDPNIIFEVPFDYLGTGYIY